MKKFYCLLICFVLFIVPLKELSAFQKIVLNHNTIENKIGLNISVLEDKTRQYSIKDVVSKDIAKLFIPSDKEVLNYGFTDSAYWIKFDVVNPYNRSFNWLLEISYPMLDNIQLFIKTNHGYKMRRAGDHSSFNTREMDYTNFTFSLQSEPKAKNSYFIRFSTSSSMNIGLKIWSPEAYMKKINNEQIVLSAFFGSILMMIFYNLLLFASLRAVSYLHHVLFMSASTLFLFTLHGLSFKYLWSNSIWWTNNCLPVLIFICNISCVTFARSFLKTREETPLFDKILLAYIILNCIFIPLMLFFSYAVAIKTATFLAVLAALLPLTISIKLALPMRQAKFYLVAWSFLLFGITVYGLKSFGILPSNHITKYSMDTGLLLEIIFLSLGIGDQINTMKKERIKAQHAAMQVQQKAFEQQQKNAKEKESLEAQIRQTHKMEALGHLAGGIAHDFNNILTTITGYAELILMDKKIPSQAEEYLYYIISAGRRAESLILQILTFSQKSVTKNSDIQLQPIVIDTAVKEVCNFIKSTIPADIHLEQNIDSNFYLALTDPTNVHQVVMNLCTNAIHSMEKTGGRLSITLSTIQTEDMPTTTGQLLKGTYLEIIVTDTGEGIAPEIIDKIFDPYYTTKEQGKGTGLGLSTVHGIVKSYDGEINIKSEIGKGSTFKVYFPAEKPGANLKKEKLQESLKTKREDGKILFLDDEETITNIYGRLLKDKYGYEIETFNCPDDALEAYNPDIFNIIITDYKMPGMNGLKFAEKIKEKHSNAKIIICSGNPSSIKDKEEGYSVFKKPLTAGKLADIIQKTLNKENK